MGERRFVILPESEVKGLGLPLMTESELKRRIQAIDLLNDLDKCIDILLHGEKRDTIKLHPEEAAQFERQIGAQKAMDSLVGGEKEQEEGYIVRKCQECGRDVWFDDQAACPHDKRLKPNL